MTLLYNKLHEASDSHENGERRFRLNVEDGKWETKKTLCHQIGVKISIINRIRASGIR